jgi:hypothetical protein
MQDIHPIVINVPGSLLKPGLTRKEAFLNTWHRNSPNVPVEFLENVCTCAEVVNNPGLLNLARKQDTFIPPPLRKLILGAPASASLSEAGKKQADSKIESIIDSEWERLVGVLKALDFNVRDSDELLREIPISYNLEFTKHLLDCVRTKITRTACTESHLRVYQKLDQSEKYLGLLLEDDLCILPGFWQQVEEIFQWLEENRPDWDIVQLGYSKHEGRAIEPIEGAPVSLAPLGAYGNTAVLINNDNIAAYKVFIRIKEHRGVALKEGNKLLANDVVIAEYAQLNRYVANVRLVGPPPGNHISVLAGKEMNYDSCCWDPEQLKILTELYSE